MLKMKHSNIQWERARVASPKFLFHVVTPTEKISNTLTEKSAHLVLLKIGIY